MGTRVFRPLASDPLQAPRRALDRSLQLCETCFVEEGATNKTLLGAQRVSLVPVALACSAFF